MTGEIHLDPIGGSRPFEPRYSIQNGFLFDSVTQRRWKITVKQGQQDLSANFQASQWNQLTNSVANYLELGGVKLGQSDLAVVSRGSIALHKGGSVRRVTVKDDRAHIHELLEAHRISHEEASTEVQYAKIESLVSQVLGRLGSDFRQQQEERERLEGERRAQYDDLDDGFTEEEARAAEGFEGPSDFYNTEDSASQSSVEPRQGGLRAPVEEYEDSYASAEFEDSEASVVEEEGPSRYEDEESQASEVSGDDMTPLAPPQPYQVVLSRLDDTHISKRVAKAGPSRIKETWTTVVATVSSGAKKALDGLKALLGFPTAAVATQDETQASKKNDALSEYARHAEKIHSRLFELGKGLNALTQKNRASESPRTGHRLSFDKTKHTFEVKKRGSISGQRDGRIAVQEMLQTLSEAHEFGISSMVLPDGSKVPLEQVLSLLFTQSGGWVESIVKSDPELTKSYLKIAHDLGLYGLPGTTGRATIDAVGMEACALHQRLALQGIHEADEGDLSFLSQAELDYLTTLSEKVQPALRGKTVAELQVALTQQLNYIAKDQQFPKLAVLLKHAAISSADGERLLYPEATDLAYEQIALIRGQIQAAIAHVESSRIRGDQKRRLVSDHIERMNYLLEDLDRGEEIMALSATAQADYHSVLSEEEQELLYILQQAIDDYARLEKGFYDPATSETNIAKWAKIKDRIVVDIEALGGLDAATTICRKLTAWAMFSQEADAFGQLSKAKARPSDLIAVLSGPLDRDIEMAFYTEKYRLKEGMDLARAFMLPSSPMGNENKIIQTQNAIRENASHVRTICEALNEAAQEARIELDQELVTVLLDAIQPFTNPTDAPPTEDMVQEYQDALRDWSEMMSQKLSTAESEGPSIHEAFLRILPEDKKSEDMKRGIVAVLHQFRTPAFIDIFDAQGLQEALAAKARFDSQANPILEWFKST